MAKTERKKIVVVGSVNLDLVATVDRLPQAGETVSGGTLEKFPGGKGANQALAARRLGADVNLVACVGDDANADAALAILAAEGVDLSACRREASAATGVALIAVSTDGENQIVVVPGANRMITTENLQIQDADAMLCQLEVPVPVLLEVTASFAGFIGMNLAPAIDVPNDLIQAADLVVVNETEASFFGDKLDAFGGLLATTYGSAGAALRKDGIEIAHTHPPAVDSVDTTGAGDAFTAALLLALIENMPPQTALEFACATGALATTIAGAQPSLPSRQMVDELSAARSGRTTVSI